MNYTKIIVGERFKIIEIPYFYGNSHLLEIRINTGFDGKIGTPIGKLKFKKEGTKIQFCNLIIEPNFRGEGLGREMLSALSEIARREKQDGIECEVDSRDEQKAKKLKQYYEANGFEYVKKQKAADAFMGKEFQIYLMQKSVNPVSPESNSQPQKPNIRTKRFDINQ